MRRRLFPGLCLLALLGASCAPTSLGPSKLDTVSTSVVDARCDQDLREADALLPPYENRERCCLSPEQFAAVSRAADIYRSLLARAPSNSSCRFYALTHLIHASVLLGNDRRYRGFEAMSKVLFADALARCDAALVLGPHYPWLRYKQGVASASLEDDARAVVFFSAAVDEAALLISGTRTIDEKTGSLEEAQDIRLRALFDRASSEMRASRCSAALTHFEELLQEPGSEHLHAGIHSSIAHLCVVRGDLESARVHFRSAIERAFDLTDLFEPLIASFVFASSVDEQRIHAEAMLDLLQKAPFDESTQAWSRVVLSYLVWPFVTESGLGIEASSVDSAERTRIAILAKLRDSGLAAPTPQALFDFVHKEEQRRNGGVLELTELQGSAWFYAGVALESRAAATADPAERRALLDEARAAFERASAHEAAPFCWPIEHARQRAASLAR